MTMRSKLLAIYERVGREIYLGREDLVIDGHRFCSTLLLELLALITRLNVLVLGEYGTGKTTSAEITSCIMAGFPLDAVIFSELRGSTEVTEEKVVGPPDLAKMSLGVNEQCWSLFVQSPARIVDELPRIPMSKQDLLLEGVRTGKWMYAGNRSWIDTERASIIATGNYDALGGSLSITPPLIDRFAIAVETVYPGPKRAFAIAFGQDASEKCSSLGLNELSGEALRVLLSPKYNAAAIQALCREFKERLAKRGFPVLSGTEMELARAEINGMPWTEEASQFHSFFSSSQSFCALAGMKRSSESGEQRTQCPSDCRFAKSACSYSATGGSCRTVIDLHMLASSFAWITGRPEVSLYHVAAAIPHVVWHRKGFGRSFLRELKDQERVLPLRLEASVRYAMQLAREFVEYKPLIAEMLANIEKHPDDLASGRLELGGHLRQIDELSHWYLVDRCRDEQLPVDRFEEWRPRT